MCYFACRNQAGISRMSLLIIILIPSNTEINRQGSHYLFIISSYSLHDNQHLWTSKSTVWLVNIYIFSTKTQTGIEKDCVLFLFNLLWHQLLSLQTGKTCLVSYPNCSSHWFHVYTHFGRQTSLKKGLLLVLLFLFLLFSQASPSGKFINLWMKLSSYCVLSENA